MVIGTLNYLVVRRTSRSTTLRWRAVSTEYQRYFLLDICTMCTLMTASLTDGQLHRPTGAGRPPPLSAVCWLFLSYIPLNKHTVCLREGEFMCLCVLLFVHLLVFCGYVFMYFFSRYVWVREADGLGRRPHQPMWWWWSLRPFTERGA